MRITTTIKPLILVSLFTLTLNSYSQHSHTRSSTENVKIEQEIHEIVHDFDFTEKLIEDKKITYSTDYEKFYVKRFVHSITGNFFREIYHKVLDGEITYSDILPLFEAKYKQISSIANLQQRYDAYIGSILAARQQNLEENEHDAPEGGSGIRTPNQPCTNLDFENGTWSSWDVFNGQACTSYVGCITGVVPGTASNGGTPQHFITSGAGLDPGNGTTSLPVSIVSPFGGVNSLRLGNLAASAYAEYIENTFLVTADKPYFSYEYAVVVESPTGHSAVQMPFFMIEFYDAGLNSITDSCGNYYVDPTTPIAKQTFDSTQLGGWAWWFYKDWARITVDLTPYIGQNVTIRFTTSDCTLGGHEGRAYIDASCHTASADVIQDCQGLRVQAPLGYHRYRWYTGNPSDSSTIVVLPSDTLDHLYIPGPGWYSVDLISETGCVINVDTVVNSIYVRAGQTVDYTEPTCNGATDGSITISPFGGVLPYQFSIDNGATWQASPIFNNVGAGNYTVITNDSQGCGDTLNLTLTEPPAIVSNLVTNDVVCFGECNGNASVVPTGGTAPLGIYRVEWNGINYGNNNLNNLCPGNYQVEVWDENGCSIVEPFIINEPPALSIDQVIVDDEICYNNCDGRIIINDVDAVEYSIDAGFTWSPNNVFVDLCAQAGPYTVAIRDANGCTATQVVNMNQPLPLQITISSDTIICLNKPAILTSSMVGGTPPYTYQWNNGKTTQAITEIPQAGYTLYSVIVTDANNCWVTGETSVTLYPQPTADFVFSPGPETDIFSTLIQFDNRSTSAGPLLYEWYFDALGTSNIRDDFFEFPPAGGQLYTNCLKIENENGCRDSICKDLYINYETLVYVPNTFTPDNDGVNDEFLPITEGLNPENYKFYIFNRWGDLIFTTSKITEGWNGTHDGEKVKQDSYVWRIVSKRLSDDSPFEQIGHINLLR